ncbi:multifunctional protein ADE2 [Biomphalaria pfeifferi]|uniref:Multifunctional protein ADE2 n=1 Tax=Biomphalaria pfeifferi TaxID=112525 RepID=A0AAD8EXV2_BIOPF|nr:multifunctional protein ADE2 [Biomphalaria pfeifferi]
MSDLKIGSKVIEGKTKIVYDLVEYPGQVLVESKDRITAGDGARAHDMAGKAQISNRTSATVFKLLKDAGIKTHFIEIHGDHSFIALKCDMIPLEWVTRRVATGSFLKRNPGVEEGYRFSPPKLETFYKDDANHDPQWTFEQCVAAKMKFGKVTIGPEELHMMEKMTITIFEILEKAWSSQNCSLIDMKIEFGVTTTGDIVLADIIDSDSWRLWPSGDKRLMKDKQVYRNLEVVTSEALDTVKSNFEWVAEKVELLNTKPYGRVVVFMGSSSDSAHGEKIKKICTALSIPCELRVTSAHKQTERSLQILAEYEGDGIPTVIIAIAGRSNGLGPVLSGNSAFPVINCPPLTPDWGSQDVWSSLRMPSGLGCTTVIDPEGAALAAAQILALKDHMVWARLRARQLNTWLSLVEADSKQK